MGRISYLGLELMSITFVLFPYFLIMTGTVLIVCVPVTCLVPYGTSSVIWLFDYTFFKRFFNSCTVLASLISHGSEFHLSATLWL